MRRGAWVVCEEHGHVVTSLGMLAPAHRQMVAAKANHHWRGKGGT